MRCDVDDGVGMRNLSALLVDVIGVSGVDITRRWLLVCTYGMRCDVDDGVGMRNPHVSNMSMAL